MAYIQKAGSNKLGVIATSDVYGTTTNANGVLYANAKSEADYSAGSNSMFISKGTLQNVLATPSIMPALTEAEQTAAQQRLGINKEWVLKGTLTTDNKDTGITVDLTGCKELYIQGYTKCTASVALITNIATLVNNVGTNGTRTVAILYEDNGMITRAVYGQYVAGVNLTALTTNLPGNSYVGKRMTNITSIIWNTPDSITECDVNIYAR